MHADIQVSCSGGGYTSTAQNMLPIGS